MERKCLKCGHVNAQATGSDIEACPQCGAIYAKVERAWAAREAAGEDSRLGAASRLDAPPPRPPAPRPAPAPSWSAPAPPSFMGLGPGSDGEFLDDLRAQSNYPAFRQVVGFLTLLGYLVAVLLAVGAVVGFFRSGLAVGLGGLVLALGAFLVARVSKEVSLMVADASDALVRMAHRQEQSNRGVER